MYHSYIENTCLVSGNQDFCGTIKGNVIVEHNVIFVNYGMICGDVNVKEGATFINRGTVNGNV